MFVLHALWDALDSKLFVWGESENLFRMTLRPKDPTRRYRILGFHPFAIKPRYLKTLVTVKFQKQLLKSTEKRFVNLLLPSAGDFPLPSPGILTDKPNKRFVRLCEEEKFKFRTWRIGALGLTGESLLEFLMSLPDKPPDGIAYGEDLVLWKDIFKRALETVKHQCFVPSVAVGTDKGHFSYAATWQPVLGNENNCLLEELSTRMPRACLAFADPDHKEISPPQAVFGFFSWCVDTFIRYSAKEYVPPKDIFERPRVLRVQERWLVGLLSNDPTLTGTRDVLSDFRHKITEWVGSLVGDKLEANSAKSSAQPHFRLCLKLEPVAEEISMCTEDSLDAETGGETPDVQKVRPDDEENLNVAPNFQSNIKPNEKLKTQSNVGPTIENEVRVVSKWRLTYYLQAEDDPSLLISAEDIWWSQADSTVQGLMPSQRRKWEIPSVSATKRVAKPIADRGTVQATSQATNKAIYRRTYLDEILLRELARASWIFSGIGETLKEPCPTGLVLDTDEVGKFLRKTAPALIERGIELLLPPWWEKPPAKIRARLRLKEESSPTTGLLGASSIVSYDWEIAVDDKSLTAEEFLRLARMKLPLVQVRGEWVRFDPDQVDRAIEFFKRQSGGKIRLGEAIGLGLGGEVPEASIPIEEVRAEGRINDILSSLFSIQEDLRMSLQSTPEGFSGQLRPYQTRGFSWLTFLRKLGFGACLADDMGLGKTIEFLAYLLHCIQREGRSDHQHEGRSCDQGKARDDGRKGRSEDRCKAQGEDPSLLVCPMSVVGNWEKEVRRFAPSLKVIVYHGQNRLSPDEFLAKVKEAHLVITTYGLVYRDRKVLSKIQWDCVALDEAQNIKNPSAKQTKAVKKLKARHRIALTGTPVENRLSELWSIMDFLNPGYLGSLKGFRQRFIVPVEKHTSGKGKTSRLGNLSQWAHWKNASTRSLNVRRICLSIIGSGEMWLTELSTEELREIVTLNKAAVGEV